MESSFNIFQILDPHSATNLLLKTAVVRLCNFCHQVKNAGQTIYVAGPLSLCMVLAVMLAVAAYSKHS